MVHCVFLQYFLYCRKTSIIITCSINFLSTAFIPCYGEGSVRIANNTSTFSRNFDGGFTSTGRVEVCYNGSYGSVCDVGWDDEDASVVCRRHFGIENGLSKYSSLLQYLL